MRILVIDTTLGACQAAVSDGARLLAVRCEPMQRGHQERLAPLVADVLGDAGIGPSDLDRVAVTTGPGSFTGLRVGLAFAKAFALARSIPCIGVTTLEALAWSGGGEGRTVAAIDAGRGQAYLQLFQSGAPAGPPEALSLELAAKRLADFGPDHLVGSLPEAFETPPTERIGLVAPDPLAIALMAADADPAIPPRPLYLRAPDARLPT